MEKMQGDAERLCQKEIDETVALYPGIELAYLRLGSDPFCGRHDSQAHILQLSYCRTGQISWKMKNGERVYLNPGDFSIRIRMAGVESAAIFPSGEYSGLTICIDLQQAPRCLPALLQSTDVFTLLQDKFCRGDTAFFLTGNEQTESIFSGFYDQPENIRLPYQKLKILELLLYLTKIEFTKTNRLAVYQSEQIEIVRKIHEQLTQSMDRRVTIAELSRQYLINPTTLKTAFKAVYGTSIAAHMKEHRMEKAAQLLRESDMSIAEIAQAVGYDSQSKFTAAFKAAFQVLPKEYRKRS